MARKSSLYDEVMDVVGEISDKANGAMNFSTKDAAIFAVWHLKKFKPTNSRLSASYAKSWTYKQTGFQKFTVHNKKYPSLVHLIEKPHDVISHGKKVRRSRGNPHVKPVEDETKFHFERTLNEQLDKLGL